MRMWINQVEASAVHFFLVFLVRFSLVGAHFTHQWAVHIEGGKEVADSVARDHGFINRGQIIEDHWHFTHHQVAKRSISPNHERKLRLAVDTRVKWSQQQISKRRVKRSQVLQDSDPKWPSMWYLNRGNGLDMNVIPVWQEGISGKGAVVTILDDGLEKNHPDLVQNYDPMASYDVNSHDSDPSPRYDMIDSNRHGTRCAGEVAATSNNSVCALGIAHGAKVGGVRMLDGDVTDAVEARSLSLNPHHIDIYSASWGPDDDGKTVDGPGEMATRAFIEGVTKGRNGKGSIFVWASGNGGRDQDNCNCDGYTNSIYSLSISSATEHGHVPWYSEACSSTLASTYSSGAVGEKQVVTTDLRFACTSSHTGTSASAPLAAGICALALEANPNLTWRDMQHIVVRTARPENLKAHDWQTNGVGRNVSHSFGYGLMDAHAMVRMARNWKTVPEQNKCEITAPHDQKVIPAKSVVILKLQVSKCEGVTVLEHVQAKLTIFSQRRGDLNIQLTSPMGTRAVLLAHRTHDNSRTGFNKWPFMSVHSWGESPLGVWELEIHNDGRLLANISGWTLVLHGTATNPNEEKSQQPSNNIDSISMNSWRGDEIRKETLEVEEEVNSTSGCANTEGRLSLECQPNHTVHESSSNPTYCSDGYYKKSINNDEEEIFVNYTCASCHYTCKSCNGSLDYDCLTCFPDAILTHQSPSENYCYPLSISWVIQTQSMYIMFVLILFALITLLFIAILWLLWKLRRNNRYDNLKNHILGILDKEQM